MLGLEGGEEDLLGQREDLPDAFGQTLLRVSVARAGKAEGGGG
jgi:hypothetical protein